MPSQEQILKDLISEIEGSIAEFLEGLPSVQSSVFDSLVDLSKELIIPARTAAHQIHNLRTLSRLNNKIGSVILTDGYSEKVKSFVRKFDEVQKIQNRYFNAVASDFKVKTLYDEIKKSYVNFTIESLTDAGVADVSSQIKKLLLQNITSGASYSKMVSDMRSYLEGNNGALVKYARQITTDSLNQYSASYTKAVTEDLGLKWYRYVGSIIKTSRPTCKALVKQDYVFYRELPTLAQGIIGGKQYSTNGMIPGTNGNTILVYRFGYNCGHQFYPVSEFAVPKEIRIQEYQKYNIPYDAEGYAVAA